MSDGGVSRGSTFPSTEKFSVVSAVCSRHTDAEMIKNIQSPQEERDSLHQLKASQKQQVIITPLVIAEVKVRNRSHTQRWCYSQTTSLSEEHTRLREAFHRHLFVRNTFLHFFLDRQTCSRLKTHVVMSQRVESLPASFLLGGQVEVGQDLTRGAGTPLCGRTREPTSDGTRRKGLERENLHVLGSQWHLLI